MYKYDDIARLYNKLYTVEQRIAETSDERTLNKLYTRLDSIHSMLDQAESNIIQIKHNMIRTDCTDSEQTAVILDKECA